MISLRYAVIDDCIMEIRIRAANIINRGVDCFCHLHFCSEMEFKVMLHFMLYLFSVSGICVMKFIFCLQILRQ